MEGMTWIILYRHDFIPSIFQQAFQGYPQEKYIDIFKGSTYHIQDQINDMKRSFYCYK